MSEKIRVLIIDDSASVRLTLSDIISADPDLEVMATASDPYVAAERIRQEVPDVIFLDIELPRMDGLTFLRKIMSQRPIPVVICSSLAEAGSDTFMQALEAGAVDVVAKPRVDTAQFLNESRMRICDAAKGAAHAKMRGMKKQAPALAVESKLTADAILPAISETRRQSLIERIPVTEPIVAIGASTGGTEALREILEGLPANCPPILIVQHMPEKFTAAFAQRLDSLCQIEVREARHLDRVRSGLALVAPGGRHMQLKRSGAQYFVEVLDGPPVNRHKPSVDVLFRSVARHAGHNALGVIMTGMGDDGARGLLAMREAGARTVAQDEASCVVFGMPKEALQLGAAQCTESLENLPRLITDYARAPLA